ncbi:MAG: hypothetical protein GWO16_15935 [Gammaproteobacteria bacterium]|nr:hypothetical protein [Gammaproteobacteria bacterium]NIR32850.1 hypothetical protein [Gammaproteobacteria bacterium]NIR99397.1 hypothetical protein [Gammaproteobacteria bacterium]NIT65011.1 hypothetical protein [Gammaproteobacteria bacterium]NIV21925.1 hypothetical protein [Gammaproteobacteria bacterium]
MSRLSRTLLALLAIPMVLPVPAPAQEQGWYQVELVVFKQRDLGGLASELWPENPGTPDLTEAVEPAAAPSPARPPFKPGLGAAPLPHRLLDRAVTELKTVARSLERAAHLEPILHLAWRQPIGEREEARPVRVRGGQRYALTRVPEYELPLRAALPGFDVLYAAPRSSTSTDGAANAEVALIPEVDGTVLLTRSRYLHVYADLVFSLPEPASLHRATPAPLVDSDKRRRLLRLRLRDHRRMRSEELHYLDHPAFGLLVWIAPYEPPEIEEPGARTGANAASEIGSPSNAGR